MTVLYIISLFVFTVAILINGNPQEGCPDGKKKHDQWTAENCTLCTCEETNTTCVGCSSQSPLVVRVNKTCYPVKVKSHENYFPRCCPTLATMCKGDEKFNEEILEYFNSLTRTRK